MKIEDLETYLPQAIFLVQGTENAFEDLLASAKSTHPLVHSLFVPRFTVDHAKSVVAFATEGDGSDRLFLIYFSVFSPDAAQALLKCLEEPAPQTTIVFMTPYPYIVPQTIRSRVTLLQNLSHIEHTPVEKMTKASVQAFIKKEFSSDSDEDAATRRAKAVTFLDALETMFKKSPDKARTIYEAKHMLLRANIPTKFVVEYAASMVF